LVYELIPSDLEKSLPNDSYIMWSMLYIQLGLSFSATLTLKRKFLLLIFPLQWNVE